MPDGRSFDETKPAGGRNGTIEITLGLLDAVHQNSAVTQRVVARDLGVALGLVNTYLKRCIRKGYIKVTRVPSARYAYYLTPQGLAEKSRLSARYLSQSLEFFRMARNQSTELLAECSEQGWTRVALCGVGDLGEIVVLCARQWPLELLAFVDADAAVAEFAGLPVVKQVAALRDVQALIVTEIAHAQEAFDRLRREHPNLPVLAPRLLRISRNPLQGDKT